MFQFTLFWRGGVYFPVLIAKGVKFTNLKGSIEISKEKRFGMISIGFGESSRKTIWDNEGRIEFKGRAHFAAGDRVSNKGSLTFGENFAMHRDSSIVSYDQITFGDDDLISWDCEFLDTDFHKIMSDGQVLNPNKPISVGNHVWFGRGCVCLKGVSIPEEVVIGAGTMLTTSINESNCVYASGRVLKRDVKWEH